MDLATALERSSCLYSLFLESALCDCELQASDGSTHPAHRVVLAASSGFFRALFVWRQQQQQQQPPAAQQGLPRYALSGVDGPSLQLLLHAVYSKRLPLTADGAAEDIPRLLAASNYLEVLPVKEAVCQHLRSQLSLGSVADTLALAAAHDCADLLADAAHFFEGHFSQLLASEEAASLAVLPPDLLRDLLCSDGLNTSSELEVARAVLLWAAADAPQRAPALADLLPAARMPPGQLAEEAARSGLLGPGGAWLLHDAAAQQAQQQLGCQEDRPPPQPPTPQPGLGGCGAPELGSAFVQACRQLQHSCGDLCGSGAEAALVSYRPRLSCATGLMMAGGLDDGWRPLRTVELYCPHTDCWSAGPLMPVPCSFAAASMLQGQTYVVEGAAHAPHVLAFDRQQQRWRQCRGLSTPRVNMAVCALEGLLFVLGGRAGIGKGAAVLSDCEYFDPVNETWHVAPPMAQPRTALAAAALDGKLWAVGGQNSRSTFATVEYFEPGAGRWVEMGAQMQQPRKYLGVAATSGRIVAVCGMTGARMRLQSAEAFDPREGRWQTLPPMSTARSSAGVATLHDSVYVVGGNIGNGINESWAGVEAYVPAAGRWRTCSAISHGRSGLAAAPF